MARPSDLMSQLDFSRGLDRQHEHRENIRPHSQREANLHIGAGLRRNRIRGSESEAHQELAFALLRLQPKIDGHQLPPLISWLEGDEKPARLLFQIAAALHNRNRFPDSGWAGFA